MFYVWECLAWDAKARSITRVLSWVLSARARNQISRRQKVLYLKRDMPTSLRSRLEVSRRTRSSSTGGERVGIGVRCIVARPSVRGRADVELALSAAAARIPVSLVGGPVADSWRACRGTVCQRAVSSAHRAVERRSRGTLRRRGYLPVIIPVGYDPGRLRINGGKRRRSARISSFVYRVWRLIHVAVARVVRGRRIAREQRPADAGGLIDAGSRAKDLVAVAGIEIHARPRTAAQGVRGVRSYLRPIARGHIVNTIGRAIADPLVRSPGLATVGNRPGSPARARKCTRRIDRAVILVIGPGSITALPGGRDVL